MRWKKYLRHLVLLVCLAFSPVPLATTHLKAESLSDASNTATKTGTAASSLSSEEAIEYLKQNGEYQSLQEAFAQAQALASIQQEAYLKASNTDANDVFGASVAISGDTVVVGAPDESSNATGANGNQADNSLLFSGAVYIFVRNGNSWSQQAYLKSSNPDAGDGFGSSVTIDGDTLVVGAPYENSNAVGVNGNQNDNSAGDSGAVYVFVRNGSTWSQQAYIKASNADSNDRFGTVLDISGNTIIVGAQYEKSNATGINGDQSDNSATNAGAAYIFVRNGTTWSQQAYLKASNNEAGDYFGASVAIEGNTAVIGAPEEDSAATGLNGNQGDNSLLGTGAAYIFEHSGTVWTQTNYVKSPDAPLCATLGFVACPNLGSAVDISSDTLVVVGNRRVTAYLLIHSGSIWNFQASYEADYNADASAQLQVSLSGDRFVLGSAGSVITIVKRTGTTWNLEEQPIVNNRHFVLDGDTLVIGDSSESSDARGINGDPNNSNAPNSGAAYIYTIVSSTTPTCAGLAQEAETTNAVLTGFTVTTDPAASGGAYIGAASGGSYYNGPNPSFKAEYCFNVPTAGTYRIKGKTYAADDLSDSFYVTVDGTPAAGYLWDVAHNTNYATDYVNDRNNADPVEVQLSAGQHYVTVYLREQGTRLDTIELEAVPTSPEPVCAGLVQEAEFGVINGDWEIGGDLAASGGSYIAAPNGSGDFWNGASNAQKASYCFNVASAGTYRIRGKVYGADTLSDSFYVSVDGSPTTGYLWDVLSNTSYASDYVSDRDVVDPVEVQLSAGQHTVNVFVREDGTRLDTIELQLVDSGPPPTPTCAGLTQEAETGALSGNFAIGSDTAASGGQYVGTPVGSGDFWNGPNANHKAEYCFNIDTAGTYRIDGKVYGADSLSDSFYVQVDGQPTNGYLWDILPNTTYAIDAVNDRNQLLDTVLVNLSVGQHTVTVYAREAGTRLDTLQLVSTLPSVQSRAMSPLAAGIGGTVRVNATNLTSEIDFSTITVTLIDAETMGAEFSQTVSADRFGNYHFDGMTSGSYIVQLSLPQGLLALSLAEPVEATREEPVTVDFEVSGESTGGKLYLPLIGR